VILHAGTPPHIALHNHDSASRAGRRIALAVGDTAGHAYPALAVAEAFRERDPGVHMLFLGTADSIAARILTREGAARTPVAGAPIRRAGIAGAGAAVTQTIASVQASRRLLAEHATGFAMGFGGFASGGVLLAARGRGIPTAIHEANVEPGLANRWLSRFVDRVFVAHPGAIANGVVVGMPIRAGIAALASTPRTPPQGRFHVLVMSGSRGSGFFEAAMPTVEAALRARGVAIEIRRQQGHELLAGM